MSEKLDPIEVILHVTTYPDHKRTDCEYLRSCCVNAHSFAQAAKEEREALVKALQEIADGSLIPSSIAIKALEALVVSSQDREVQS